MILQVLMNEKLAYVMELKNVKRGRISGICREIWC